MRSSICFAAGSALLASQAFAKDVASIVIARTSCPASASVGSSACEDLTIMQDFNSKMQINGVDLNEASVNMFAIRATSGVDIDSVTCFTTLKGSMAGPVFTAQKPWQSNTPVVVESLSCNATTASTSASASASASSSTVSASASGITSSAARSNGTLSRTLTSMTSTVSVTGTTTTTGASSTGSQTPSANASSSAGNSSSGAEGAFQHNGRLAMLAGFVAAAAYAL